MRYGDVKSDSNAHGSFPWTTITATKSQTEKRTKLNLVTFSASSTQHVAGANYPKILRLLVWVYVTSCHSWILPGSLTVRHLRIVPSPEGMYFVGTDEKKNQRWTRELVLGRVSVLHGCTGPNLTYPKHDGFPKMYLRLQTWAIFSQPKKHHASFSAYAREKYGKSNMTMENSDHLKMYFLLFFHEIVRDFPSQVQFSGFFQGVFTLQTFPKITQPSIPTLWFLRILGFWIASLAPTRAPVGGTT